MQDLVADCLHVSVFVLRLSALQEPEAKHSPSTHKARTCISCQVTLESETQAKAAYCLDPGFAAVPGHAAGV
jgi:hypothetical protein